VPGLKTIKTPIKPKKIAIHLRTPTFSSKINIAKIVIIIILAKLIEDTSARGRIPKALKKLNIAKQAITALNKCKLIFEVFKGAFVITTIIKTGNNPKKHLKKTMWKVSKSDESFFINTSINTKKITDNTLSDIAI
jgi:hypothetical protein